MSVQPELVDYYAKRAREYERVYDKPERQSDLARLHEIVPVMFAGRRVLEIACGTGYWTAPIASPVRSMPRSLDSGGRTFAWKTSTHFFPGCIVV